MLALCVAADWVHEETSCSPDEFITQVGREDQVGVCLDLTAVTSMGKQGRWSTETQWYAGVCPPVQVPQTVHRV